MLTHFKNCFTVVALVFASFFCAQAQAFDAEALLRENWLQVNSKNFEITTDLDEKSAWRLAQDMETFRYFTIQRLDILPLGAMKPLRILAMSKGSSISAVDLPMTFNGVFVTRADGYATIASIKNYRPDLSFPDAGRHTLFHEYLHFAIRFSNDSKHVPLWYDEGYADYWSTFQYNGTDILVGNDSAANRAAALINDDTNKVVFDSEVLFSTKVLPPTDGSAVDRKTAEGIYTQSFYFMHYFNSSKPLQARLKNYLKYINAGYSDQRAVKLAFEMTYEELDAKVISYLNKRYSTHTISLPGRKIIYPTFDTTIKALAPAEIMARVAYIVPKFGFLEPKDIKEIQTKNLQLNPHSAEAKIAMLRNNLADKPAVLLADLEKNNASDPSLLIYKGDQLLAQANLQRTLGRDGWQATMGQARDQYRLALKGDRFSSLAQTGLANSYRYTGLDNDSQEAILAMDVASLFDRSGEPHANLAKLYMRLNDSTEATYALRSAVAFSREAAQSKYSLSLDNMELLNDVLVMQGRATETGFSFANGSVYTGALLDEKPNGIGKLVRPNESYYEGNFADGVMHGKGKIVTIGGFIYEGDFKDGIAIGKGKITYPKEYAWISYEGEVNYGLPHGEGARIDSNGRYEGEFWYGSNHGEGGFQQAKGRFTLSGRWVDNQYVWTPQDGVVFVGKFNNAGKRDGKGWCTGSADVTLVACTFQADVKQVDAVK